MNVTDKAILYMRWIRKEVDARKVIDKFNVYEYPDYFDLILIESYGWYKAKNRGDNLNGISRDHIYSVREGFLNDISPYIISHPANCELLRHKENQRKRTRCDITVEELKEKIKNFVSLV